MYAAGEFLFPFVKERPVDGTGAEIRHVLVAVESVDGGLQEFTVVAEGGAVAWKQPFDTAVLDACERFDEGGQIGTVVGINAADATIPKDVVPGKEQIPQSE
jgi:hypothetical protein